MSTNVMTTNKIVSNALKARNGKFKVGDKVRHNGGASGVVGGTGVIVEQGSQNDKVYKVKWDRSSDSARYGDKWLPQELLDKVVNSVATNADNRPETASFGNNDVKCEIADYGKGPGFHISVYTDGLSSSGSWGDKGKKCINDAKTVLKAMERKASALKQAIAWMEQTAKKW